MTNYCSVEKDKRHILSLIEWIWNEVKSAGGDGDALWYSKYYNIKDLFPLINEFNNSQSYSFSVCELSDNEILWWDNQESIVITNDQKRWDNKPDWQQVSIEW